MTRARRAGAAAATIGVCLAAGLAAGCSERGYETQNGIAFLRHSDALRDAVAHRGTLSVAEDKCLYVTVEGVTYWAALAPGDKVDQTGVTSGTLQVSYGSPATFERATGEAEVSTEFRERCKGATEYYGIGLS